MPTNESNSLADAISALTRSQQDWVRAVISQFALPHSFVRDDKSDLITTTVLNRFGDALRIHHAFSRQPLSKDRFEYAFERSLNLSGFDAALVKSRTNRGHDLTINGTPVSLKTEAASAIKRDLIHVSKWMELGKGEWELYKLLELFFEHLQNYERIFTLRCLQSSIREIEYELVEIPKSLLIRSKNCILSVCETSRQNPKPGYGYVFDKNQSLDYALYFDGGTERKLQVKKLKKTLCITHAEWKFESLAL